MFKKPFIKAWIFSSLGMLGLCYLWHGFFLLDFTKTGVPMGVNLLYKLGIYLVTGFVITKAVTIQYFDKWILNIPIVKGIVIGGIVGVLFFMVATFKGISHHVFQTYKYLILNLFWQIFEQGFGGLIIWLTYTFTYNPDREIEE